MPSPNSLLSQKHFEYLLEGSKNGVFPLHSLISHVHVGQKLIFKNSACHFEKERAGQYAVFMYRNGVKIGEVVETTVLSAKLAVLSYLEAEMLAECKETEIA